MPEPEDKRSRREKRRQAQADAGSQTAEERFEETESQAAGEEPSEDSADEPAAAEKPKKSKKRAEASTTEAIRDRNRRVREQAAERRRADRDQERSVRVASGLDASEMVDDALARSTHAVTGWLKRHFNMIQWVIVVGVVLFAIYQAYSYRRARSEERASDKLAEGVEAESGRVGGAAPPPSELEEVDTRPAFADERSRLRVAEQAYREAATQRPGSGTAILAELGLGGVLYDQGKFDEAKKSYEAVKNSELASHDVDVKARAIEGIGNVLEAKKDNDGAQKAFRELENLSVPRLTALGLYHQARIAFAKGETDKAKEFLKKVQERLEANKPPGETPGYLEIASAELARTIDPKAASTLPPGYSLEQIDSLQKQIMTDPTKLEELLKKMGKSFGTPAPSGAPPPAPPENAPEESGEAP